jgi:phosphatidylserine decarboxylase
VFAPGAGRVIGLPAVVALFLAVVVVGAGLSGGDLALVAVPLAIAAGFAVFFAVFFRDPDRRPGEGIVSAADGRVREIAIEDGRLRISVFMNVTDVHVNRFPIDARVDDVSEAGSGFRPAYRSDADHNVRRRYLLSSPLGPVEVVQITGVVARRLVAFVHAGTSARKGDRLGMIILGSRVDVLLPADRVLASVKVGDRVRAGSSSIARERS